MSDNLALQEKRNELKRQLTTGEYQTLFGRMCAGASRFIQRITRSTKPLPAWYGAVVIGLSQLLIFGLLPLLAGEADLYRASYGSTSGVRLLVGGCFIIGLQVAGPLAVLDGRYRSIFASLADRLLDSIESTSDLTDLQRWLMAVSSVRKPLFIGIVYTVIIAPYNVVFLSKFLGVFIGAGGIYAQLVTCFFSGISVYYGVLFASFHTRIHSYRFKLYAADPSNSEAINCLSDIFSRNEYVLGVFLAFTTLVFALLGVLSVYGIVVVIVGWIPMIVIFAIHHYVLARIITTAKWTTLYGIQAQIERLEAQEDTPTDDTLEHIGKLMDYYDRIKATHNSALDLRAGLSFLNSLLLPLVAFILGNLDTIVALFHKP